MRRNAEAVKTTLDKFRTAKNGKPKLLIAKTIIGKGLDEVAGTNAAHGEAGVAYVEDNKKRLGLTEPWQVFPDTYKIFEPKQNSEVMSEFIARLVLRTCTRLSLSLCVYSHTALALTSYVPT